MSSVGKCAKRRNDHMAVPFDPSAEDPGAGDDRRSFPCSGCRSRLHGWIPMAVDGTSAPGAKNFPLPVSPASGDPDQHSSRMRLQRQNSWLRPGRSAALALRSPLAAPALFRLPGHERIAIATGHSPTRWRKIMRNIAEFTLIGRVGTIKQVGKTVRVSICANYPFKDDKGQWKDDAHWNEVTIFTKAIQSYVNEHISKGDLVHVRGRLRQNSFERDGQRVYTVDLIGLELGRLAQASERVAA
ncbi:single-stranded DNA-binding protein [Rhodopseudomonas sp. BAL398]|jgi:hypothetical protein|nr:single-stranded DNA-binding protein [Rhodopseudomonas sp. BAL398]MDF3813214.1 single-stranded DNA-binding protein [Rhodopseudomonas sp. BAL398]